ncbi:aminoglycoside phosphotransferase (APT) family kinase protein [Actinocorallia herbida]|uniref:Aminoglycoside phosphotransferase (APT) family kinase protein n=1 Tax=Actinocorallia herbida TaxID=58109 RepID=A0A3N1D358_9ACTN|nr:phosphotransferase family protein [Actinocorallia herbida]ROO87930.1 aminoglycoside phosphotransferase (APT) family kinase protein [Actinocorallia herbida]
MSASTAELIDSLRARATRAAQAWAPGARISEVRPLTGGASSLTFIATVEGGPAQERSVVLKVAPPGLAPVRNRDVLRQSRVMWALHGRPGVRVPRVLFEDAGEPPEIPPFHAMSLVPGECVEPVLEDDRDPAGRPTVRARALDAAGVLAALHRVVPADVGLADEPVVSLAEEIDRWTKAFATVPADLQGDYERCARALHATMPAPLPPVVNHGDYRLGNTLCRGDRVEAVIDWEIWSVGDPRVDLTWFTFFTDEGRHPAAPSGDPTGMPTGGELLDAYLTVAGLGTPPDLDWFTALTYYKEAGATALLIKRGRRAETMHPAIRRMIPALPGLLREAERILDGTGPRRRR